MNKFFIQKLIRQHTKLTRNHLTPELCLRLITPDCLLWNASPDRSPFDDPFWAFFWPGGQVLTRYILDNPKLFYKTTVLDVGSGCGSTALAAKLVGASRVVANDIDPVAEVAIEINMEANALQVTTDTSNRLSSSLDEQFDFILIGDMFYDPLFTDLIATWLQRHKNASVLIGDPGRYSFKNHPIQKQLEHVAEYVLPRTCQIENNGLTTGNIWLLKNDR
ncbi:unnamed protein product [Lymnaea stagnalis]|uniref:ETFB lysine methyltransferase n=1 Tax=Lymnaea stagnalis TaxID=6523 RepID=A0AAV2HG24_LYMST